MGHEPENHTPARIPSWCSLAVVGSAAFGLALIADQATRMSATYDEVTYLKVAAQWWRTGEQDAISRMGSPLAFWKAQQAPTLWALDRLGLGAWVDDPVAHQAELLPAIRIGASWVWLVALLIAANWARLLHGPRGMAMAAVLFALSPNLLAHGSLATMEMPLVACSSAMLLGFWSFLESGKARGFWLAAVAGGLGMSCKFTTVLIPPILALLWAIDLLREEGGGRVAAIVRTVVLGMVRFAGVMVLADLVVTGFATLPLSGRSGPHPLLEAKLGPGLSRLASRLVEVPLPADWVGFANQVVLQGAGGPSYLLGERRMTGWTIYYPVALAVKVPLAFWALAVGRSSLRRRAGRGWMLPAFAAAFLLIAMVGSKRNYGFRYLLPMAAPAVVWASGLAEGGKRWRCLAVAGLVGMGASVASIHPHELSYFNAAAGGPIGGRRVLSDSNLDWGQGAKALARLQRARAELRDLTVFYFGDTDPAFYGVEGKRFVFDANRAPDGLPPALAVDSKFLAVSASLQWGPWGPPGYFHGLDRASPVAYTDDSTIAIYRGSDIPKPAFRTGRGPG